MFHRLIFMIMLLVPSLAISAVVPAAPNAPAAPAAPAAVPQPFTQKDFALKLLAKYGWNDGLPANPGDRDLLVILNGKRLFRYEAENAYNQQSDRVTVNELNIYGPFTGKGWVRGISEPTISTLTFLMPLKGDYLFKAAIKGNGFVWNLDGREFRGDSNSKTLREVELGKIALKAGVTKIKVTIPTDGAIDSFTFVAQDHVPLQPFVGWRFREPLTAGRVAEIAVSLAGRFDLLPDAADKGQTFAMAQAATFPQTVVPSIDTFLGPFTSASWLRADYRGGTVQLPVKVPLAGYYTVRANILGTQIGGSVNDTSFTVAGKPYLSPVTLGVFRFEAGENTVSIVLPPNGGIDTVEIRRKETASEAFLTLAGVKGPADRLVLPTEADEFLTGLRKTYPDRK